MEWLWVALAIVFMVIELNTFRLIAIWASVSALVVLGLRYVLPIGLVYQGLIFLGLSAILILIGRPLVKRIINRKK